MSHRIVWYRQALDTSFKKMKHKEDFDFPSQVDAEVHLEKIYQHCKKRLNMEIEAATNTMFVAFSPAMSLRQYDIRHIYIIEEA